MLIFVMVLVLVGATTNAVAEPTTFFGEDLGLGGDTRLPSTPNADAARDEFFLHLSNVGIEDFESFVNGTGAPLAVDFGPAGTATLQGTGYVREVSTGTYHGRYPISGDKYWEARETFYIEFSEPEVALGFYGVDVGDYSGQLTITYEDGSTQTIIIPHTVDSPSGSVIYFGFIDSDKPFINATFGNTEAGVDNFGFDDFTIGTSEQIVTAAVPTLTPSGLIGLVGLLSLVATSTLF